MFVIRKKIIYGLEKNPINIINTWKDIYIYIYNMNCKVRKLIPRIMRIKERKDYKTRNI